MKRFITAALIAATMATSASATSVAEAHKKVQECYFPATYSTSATAYNNIHKVGNGAAIWLKGSGTRYISVDLEDGKWKTESHAASVKWNSRDKARCTVKVDKNGYIILRKGKKTVLIGKRNRCKEFCNHYITAAHSDDRLHGYERMYTEVTHVATAKNGVKVVWKKAPLADFYRVLAFPYDSQGIGIPAKQIIVSEGHKTVVPNTSTKITIIPTREGAYGVEWESRCTIEG